MDTLLILFHFQDPFYKRLIHHFTTFLCIFKDAPLAFFSHLYVNGHDHVHVYDRVRDRVHVYDHDGDRGYAIAINSLAYQLKPFQINLINLPFK
jgi:hypothetical protein